MGWNKNEPTKDGDFSLRDDAIRANFAAIETCIGKTNLSDGETLFDTSDGHDHDGTNSRKISGNQLDAWASRSNDTVYQATTDGFVIGYTAQTGNADNYIIGYTDSSNPPTTIRWYDKKGRAGDTFNYFRAVIMMLVRKSDYWKVSSNQSITLYWIPFGV